MAGPLFVYLSVSWWTFRWFLYVGVAVDDCTPVLHGRVFISLGVCLGVDLQDRGLICV